MKPENRRTVLEHGKTATSKTAVSRNVSRYGVRSEGTQDGSRKKARTRTSWSTACRTRHCMKKKAERMLPDERGTLTGTVPFWWAALSVQHGLLQVQVPSPHPLLDHYRPPQPLNRPTDRNNENPRRSNNHCAGVTYNVLIQVQTSTNKDRTRTDKYRQVQVRAIHATILSLCLAAIVV